ncbi:hypothetical protein D3C80_976410 [compost metagenome]
MPAQGGGEPATTSLGLGPGAAEGAVDQRRIVGINPGGPRQKTQGGQGLEIGGALVEANLIDVLLCHRVPSSHVAQSG